MSELRDYQIQTIELVRGEFRKKIRRVMVVKPTGAGKTRTAVEMVAAAYERRTTVLWLADRGELVDQASEAMHERGVPHGMIIPGKKPGYLDVVHVGTIQSFLSRHKRGKLTDKRPYGLIVLDEAHRSESDTYKQLLALYPEAFVIGLSATPVRGDGKGLGRTFKGIVQPVTTKQLIERGFLVPPRYFVPDPMDLAAGKIKSRDYSAKALEAIADANPQLVGDLIETFLRVCPDRKGLVFPCTIAQSLQIREAFLSAGISACHIDGETDQDERNQLMRDFRAGKFQIMTSVNIAIEGLDVPEVSCVIMARPTKSERIWIQAVGRGLRTYPGKKDCIILDHGGVVLNLGPAEDYQDWELGDDEGKVAEKKKKQPRDPKEISCDNCKAMFFSSKICPECGHEHTYERAPAEIVVAEGELEEMTAEGRKKLKATQEEKKIWWAGIQWYVQQKGRKPGLAYYIYQERFECGPGPWQKSVKASPPTKEVEGWLKYRDIKRAKSNGGRPDRARGSAHAFSQ